MSSLAAESVQTNLASLSNFNLSRLTGAEDDARSPTVCAANFLNHVELGHAINIDQEALYPEDFSEAHIQGSRNIATALSHAEKQVKAGNEDYIRLLAIFHAAYTADEALAELYVAEPHQEELDRRAHYLEQADQFTLLVPFILAEMRHSQQDTASLAATTLPADILLNHKDFIDHEVTGSWGRGIGTRAWHTVTLGYINDILPDLEFAKLPPKEREAYVGDRYYAAELGDLSLRSLARVVTTIEDDMATARLRKPISHYLGQNAGEGTWSFLQSCVEPAVQPSE